MPRIVEKSFVRRPSEIYSDSLQENPQTTVIFTDFLLVMIGHMMNIQFVVQYYLIDFFNLSFRNLVRSTLQKSLDHSIQESLNVTQDLLDYC